MLMRNHPRSPGSTLQSVSDLPRPCHVVDRALWLLVRNDVQFDMTHSCGAWKCFSFGGLVWTVLVSSTNFSRATPHSFDAPLATVLLRIRAIFDCMNVELCGVDEDGDTRLVEAVPYLCANHGMHS